MLFTSMRRRVIVALVASGLAAIAAGCGSDEPAAVGAESVIISKTVRRNAEGSVLLSAYNVDGHVCHPALEPPGALLPIWVDCSDTDEAPAAILEVACVPAEACGEVRIVTPRRGVFVPVSSPLAVTVRAEVNGERFEVTQDIDVLDP